uniref:Uncharacterized protein n=1 Tax=Opuntia streptacantha TaxID=393608 RepID=A0A7C9CR12_OPUST
MSKKKQNQFLLLIPKISSSPVSYCYPQNFERPFVFSPQSPLVRSIAHSLSLSLSPSLASTLSLVHCDPAKWTRYASKLFHHWQRQREVSRRDTLVYVSIRWCLCMSVVYLPCNGEISWVQLEKYQALKDAKQNSVNTR